MFLVLIMCWPMSLSFFLRFNMWDFRCAFQPAWRMQTVTYVNVCLHRCACPISKQSYSMRIRTNFAQTLISGNTLFLGQVWTLVARSGTLVISVSFGPRPGTWSRSVNECGFSCENPSFDYENCVHHQLCLSTRLLQNIHCNVYSS